MGKLALALLIGVVGAGLVHIAVIFTMPDVARRNAWGRLAELGKLDDVVRVAALDSAPDSVLASADAPAGDFAFVDPALGHLPGFDHIIDALADEDLAFHVDEHDADAGAIPQFLFLGRQSRKSPSLCPGDAHPGIAIAPIRRCAKIRARWCGVHVTNQCGCRFGIGP